MARRDPARRRLVIIMVLVGSMLLTLAGRLYYVQLLDPHKPTQTAGMLHEGSYVIPAPRGDIVDARGKTLVGTTTVQVITVDRETLQQLPDHGSAVLHRLAGLLHTSPDRLAREITPCSPTVSAPCWTGEPYQPVPVAIGAAQNVVLAVSERREDYPGVAVQTRTQLTYPHGTLAAHVLGYTGKITESDQKRDPSLHAADLIGKTGLQEYYDQALRGTDGKQVLQLTPQGYAVGSGRTIAPVAGDTLVTSIDIRLQKLAERSLAKQIRQTRKDGKPATSGAVVIMDPNTGRVRAVASYPSYDPQLFVGGISNAQYARLTAPSANEPLLSRAIGGAYAPGSTFKLITASSLVMHDEITTDGIYPCPGYLYIDGRKKTNYDSEVLGPIDLRDALGYSCDTFFYAPEAAEYYADQQRIADGKKPHEYLQHMAAEFGVGTKPGIDLPAGQQSAGSYADRESRMARWKANKDRYCATAKWGYPNVKDKHKRAYLTRLASENCTDGWRYRAGDNADMAIGQGETTLSPLQLAVAYSAMLNGGKIFEPTLGWAIVDHNGTLVKKITPKVRNRVPVRQSLFNYIAHSLSFSRGWAVSGAFAYIGSSYQDKIGGKTGTAEVFGKVDTSWLASWGPVHEDAHGNVRAQYVMVGMITQAGTGATAAGPMLKRIWDGILGPHPVLPGGKPVTKLPKVSTTR